MQMGTTAASRAIPQRRHALADAVDHPPSIAANGTPQTSLLSRTVIITSEQLLSAFDMEPIATGQQAAVAQALTALDGAL